MTVHARPALPPPSYDVLGFKLTPTTIAELLEIVDQRVASGKSAVVASQNIHGFSTHLRDADFRALHRSPDTYIHLDGMPLVLLCRLAGLKVFRRHRVTWVDFIDPLMTRANERQWKVYFLGSSVATLRSGLAVLRARFPHVTFTGHDGYFEDTGPESDAVVRDIRAARPTLLLLGMGMGRQERWYTRNAAALGVPVTFTTGACLEYVAGTVRTPPRWLGQSGLEWLFRLAEDPKRFAYRYLIEPWPVLAVLLRRIVAGYVDERT